MGVVIFVVCVIVVVGVFAYLKSSKKQKPKRQVQSYSRSSGNTGISGSWYPAKVSGVTFNNDNGTSRQEIIEKCIVGEELELVREPDNQYDQLAVKVCRTNGAQIGYVNKNFSGNVARAFDEEHKIPRARVKKIGKEKGNNYCVIEINFKEAKKMS